MLPRCDELWSALRPIDAVEQSVSEELYDFCNGASNTFGDISARFVHDDFSDSFSNFSHVYEEPVLLQDCMWAGTSTIELLKSSMKAAVAPPVVQPSEPECHILIPTKDLFDPCPVPESANDSGPQNKPTATVCVPYTPDSDHCYFQPKSVPKVQQPPQNVVVKEEEEEDDDDDDESDSDSSGNSGDEIDIETVTDDGPSLCAIKLQRTIKKGFYQRENLPPSSYRSYNNTNQWKISSTIKRTKANVNQKKKQRTRRGRRPANSLPCSPRGSSRSNSDSEEPVKRSMHNNMERRRREEQRSALQHLRVQIPELKCVPKAPKVTILRKAKLFIMYMESKNSEMQRAKDTLRQKQLILLKKLKTLDKKGLFIKEFEDCYR